MSLIQRSFGVCVAGEIIGIGQFPVPELLLIFGEMLTDVPTFMQLASLDKNTLTPVLLDRRSQCAPAINDGHHVLLETQSPLDEPIQQLIADLLVLCCS